VRIIGGEEASIKDFPYIASFQLHETKIYLCSGAIISHWHILSAAHCFIDVPNGDIRIYTGTDDSQNYSIPYYTIKGVKLHPDFSGRKTMGINSENDIAVVTVRY
jgi:secreted trypsin-like serine protease